MYRKAVWLNKYERPLESSEYETIVFRLFAVAHHCISCNYYCWDTALPMPVITDMRCVRPFMPTLATLHATSVHLHLWCYYASLRLASQACMKTGPMKNPMRILEA